MPASRIRDVATSMKFLFIIICDSSFLNLTKLDREFLESGVFAAAPFCDWIDRPDDPAELAE